MRLDRVSILSFLRIMQAFSLIPSVSVGRHCCRNVCHVHMGANEDAGTGRVSGSNL